VSDSAAGILLQPSGATGSLFAILRNVRVQNNSNSGLFVSPKATVVVDKSSFSGNVNGIFANATGANAAVVMVSDSVVAGNSAAGIRSNGASSRVRVGNSVITANQNGLSVTGGGIMNTYGTNKLDGNQTTDAFTSPAIPQQ